MVAVPIMVYWYIERSAKPYIYTDPHELPETKTALVLGTAKYISGGYRNAYFLHRIQAAYAVYSLGKSSKFILSGDNSNSYYNEPEDMKQSLMAEGVPEDAIVLDYAGLRTLDSVLRAKIVFGQEEFIIVSQAFHLARALYICRQHGIKAYGFVAKESPDQAWKLRQRAREVLARVLTIIDIHILQTQPKHLGKPISIE
jgi:SanA protein